MAKNKNHSWLRKLLGFVSVAPVLFRVVNNFIALMDTELRLVGKKLFLILLLSLTFGLLLTSTWLCLLFMIFVYLISLQLSWMTALFIILILNILLLFIIILLMLNIKKELFFPQTRRLLLRIKDE